MADSFQMKFATAVIVLVLGLQFLAVVTRSGKWAWPFIDYPMYSTSHQEGERVPARHVIYGITSDGAKVELTRQAIGVNLWMHEKWARDLKNLEFSRRDNRRSGDGDSPAGRSNVSRSEPGCSETGSRRPSLRRGAPGQSSIGCARPRFSGHSRARMTRS